MYDDSWKLVPCKLSLRSLNLQGYSRIGGEQAHRVIWKKTYGPIPDGIEVCHKCPARNCIEPVHLFLGTHKENMEDAVKKGTIKSGKNGYAEKTHCKHGHEFTPENTRIKSNGTRACIACTNFHNREASRRNYRWARDL